MSTERITRLQSLLERIKKNGALPRSASHLVFSGARGAGSDVATGPSVPAIAAQSPAKNTDVASPGASMSAVDFDATPATLTGAARVPTISGMAAAAPVAELADAEATPIDVIEELDIDEIDVVDITEQEAEPPTSSVEVSEAGDVTSEAPAPTLSIPTQEIREDELSWSEPPAEEGVPDSSPRPRAAAASLDEALAEAAEAESAGQLKTPPPQSGRQPMDGVYASVVPTPEQLGETVELEAPTSAELELDLKQTSAHKPKEELEFELPPRESALEPPSREEISTYTNEAEAATHPPEQSQVRNLPEEVDTVETPAVVAPEVPEPSTDRDSQPLKAELTSRVTAGKAVTPEFVFAAPRFQPKSFAELLDASLMLVPKE